MRAIFKHYFTSSLHHDTDTTESGYPNTENTVITHSIFSKINFLVVMSELSISWTSLYEISNQWGWYDAIYVCQYCIIRFGIITANDCPRDVLFVYEWTRFVYSMLQCLSSGTYGWSITICLSERKLVYIFLVQYSSCSVNLHLYLVLLVLLFIIENWMLMFHSLHLSLYYCSLLSNFSFHHIFLCIVQSVVFTNKTTTRTDKRRVSIYNEKIRL